MRGGNNGMRVSLTPFEPFEKCAWITVQVTPLQYVLFVGKLWDCVPPRVPTIDVEVDVFVDLPGGTPMEGLEWLAENHEWLERRAAEWLISPMGIN